MIKRRPLFQSGNNRKKVIFRDRERTTAMTPELLQKRRHCYANPSFVLFSLPPSLPLSLSLFLSSHSAGVLLPFSLAGAHHRLQAVEKPVKLDYLHPLRWSSSVAGARHRMQAVEEPMKLDFLHSRRSSSSPILSRRCIPPAGGGWKTDETGRFCIGSAAANCLRSRLLLVRATHRLQAVEQPMKPGLLPSPMWSLHDINHLI